MHNKVTPFFLLVFLLSAFSTSSQSRETTSPQPRETLLAPVKIGDQWGYIDKSGKIAISPQFDFAWSFKEGMAPIQLGGKCGYIDRTGKIVINPQFEFAWSFQEGVGKIKLGGKYGYIDRTGKTIA